MLWHIVVTLAYVCYVILLLGTVASLRVASLLRSFIDVCVLIVLCIVVGYYLLLVLLFDLLPLFLCCCLLAVVCWWYGCCWLFRF